MNTGDNGFAVAATTAALANRLHAMIADAVPGTRVTTLNPGAPSLRTGDPIVNLYLFRAPRNGSVSNTDLPSRGPFGKPLASPTLMLDLDYMITYFGDEARLDPQRLLGIVAGGLNAAPYLDRDSLRAAIAATPWLSGTTVDNQAARIRITPMNLLPDALARLWSEFVNVPYQLTQLYTVTPVALAVDLPVEPVLPVRRIGIRALPAGLIAIRGVVNADYPDLPISAGNLIAIRMENPSQSGLTVLLNGAAATGVRAGSDSEGKSSLLFTLDASQPTAACTADLAVQVIAGAGKDKIAAQSVRWRVLVCPGFAQPPVAAEGQIKVTLVFPVAPDAEMFALLFATAATAPAASRRIRCLPRASAQTVIQVPAADIAAGTYLFAIEIDGLMSVLDYAGAHYTGPLVTIAASPTATLTGNRS